MSPKKKKRSEKSTHTPFNMAAPNIDVNKTNSPVSQIISAANDSIYGTSYRNIHVVPSVNQHNTQMNNQQQYFQQQTLPNMDSTMPGACITTTLTLSSNTFILPTQSLQVTNCLQLAQFDNSTVQMLLSTINQRNERLNKLDMLGDIWVQISDKEKHYRRLDYDTSDIRNDLNQQAHGINNDEFYYNIVEERVYAMECEKGKIIS